MSRCVCVCTGERLWGVLFFNLHLPLTLFAQAHSIYIIHGYIYIWKCTCAAHHDACAREMFFEKNPSPCNKTFMLSARLFLSFMYFYVRAAAVKSCGFYFYNMLRDIDTKCIVIKVQVHAMRTAPEWMGINSARDASWVRNTARNCNAFMIDF